MPDSSATSNNKAYWLNAVGGAGLGAFIAFLLALSNTDVVSATLSVFLGAAVVFLSLHDKISPNREKSMSTELLYRIIGFTFAGIFALFIGLFLRASNPFGDSEILRLHNDLIEIGIEKNVAREVVIEHLRRGKKTEETERERLVHSTTLFSSSASIVSCLNMEPNKFNNLESLITRYQAEGGGWKIIASIISKTIEANPSLDGVILATNYHSIYCMGYLK